MDPLSTIDVDADSSFVLMEEAHRRGMAVWHTTPDSLWFDDGRIRARVREIVPVRPDVFEHRRWLEAADLGEAHVIFMRKDPPFDIEYIRTTYLLDVLAQDRPVVNDPGGLRDTQEKLWLLRWPELAPVTVSTRSPERIRAFVAEHGGRAIVKPWDGNAGRGVFLLSESDPNLGVLLETITGPGKPDLLLQPYLEEIRHGDKRIILVDGEARAGFLRIPQGSDHRGNMHVGARVEGCDLNVRDLEICAAIGPALKASGQIFVGIDVIGDYLTEVNVTSPTGIQEANRFHGTRLEAEIFDAIF
jgi:glutathione synthase